MPRCKSCGKTADGYVLRHAKMHLCKECFIKYYERKVLNTILKHGMLKGARFIAVAVSGGKDSSALLRVLRKMAPELKMAAIHLNLGIAGYSDECQKTVEELCSQLDVNYVVYDLRREEGFSIPDFQDTPYGRRICGVCGTVKRYLLNKIAYRLGADRIATGHNLDDVVEILFELYLRGAVEELVRIRPVSWSTHPKMVHRIKPLIEMTEEENLYYSSATETPFTESKCPLGKGSRMMKRKELIALLEKNIQGFRHMLYKSHVKRILPKLEQSIEEPTLKECKLCGMPALKEICSYCKISSKVRKADVNQP